MKIKLLLFFSIINYFCLAQTSSSNPNFNKKIPFELTKFNNIKVRTILNKKDTIFLTFDTGATDFYLIKDAIKKYLNPNNLKILTMEDISDNNFKIENLEWNHQQVYPIETTGHETEGMFGWNMFEGKILEIDYDKNIMTVHDELPIISKDYEEFLMEFHKGYFLISLDIQNDNNKYKSNYLFDTGFQKAVMLDNDLLKIMDFPSNELETMKTTILHNSNNEEIPLTTVKIQKLIFGKYTIENVPSELNTFNKPSGFKTNFLGSDILKRFNIILDFQCKIVYLKPNQHFNDKYFDEKEKS